MDSILVLYKSNLVIVLSYMTARSESACWFLYNYSGGAICYLNCVLLPFVSLTFLLDITLLSKDIFSWSFPSTTLDRSSTYSREKLRDS